MRGTAAEQVATAIAPLMVRAQGLQILRDSAFTLCVDRMNGWIEKELQYLPARTAVPAQTLPPLPLPPAASAPLPTLAASGATH